MFNKTYLTQYISNRQIFQQFFDGIKKYYNEYPIDIRNVIIKLFSNITKIMFNLFTKSKYNQSIDEKCIELNFDRLEPFGSLLPKQIIKQLKKSLNSVKMLSSGLTKLRDLIIDIYSKFQNPSVNCKRALTRMIKCSTCIDNSQIPINRKINDIKPCYTYCLHTFETCFVTDLDQLDFIWNSHLSKYIKAFLIVKI